MMGEQERLAWLDTIHEAEKVEDNFPALQARLDALASSINRRAGGREVSLAITNLETAEMWLGRAIGAMRKELR